VDLFGDETLEVGDGDDGGALGCAGFLGDSLAHEGGGGDAECGSLFPHLVDEALGEANGGGHKDFVGGSGVRTAFRGEQTSDGAVCDANEPGRREPGCPRVVNSMPAIVGRRDHFMLSPNRCRLRTKSRNSPSAIWSRLGVAVTESGTTALELAWVASPL